MVVSVVMITYGHENYIRQAIEGVLMQNCNFAVELIVANDCSPDTTDYIINDIIQNYPEGKWITYYNHHENLGMMANFNFAIQQAKGKYIALCDGDDYWTDPHKLQKQVDFLEANSDYAMCTHVAKEVNEIINTEHFFPIIIQDTSKRIEDYLSYNLTATCSLIFRREYIKEIPKWFTSVMFGDWALMLFIFYRSKKKMMILQHCMSVYRINDGSIHGSLKKDIKSLIKAYKIHLDFIELIDKKLFLKNEYQKYILKKKQNTYLIIEKFYKKESSLMTYKYKLLKLICKIKLVYYKND